ncbi:MAG: tRNA(His) 5'-end guanylyltransferase [Roseivirga sp.]|jgi:tRNA(His) 5'-end guanylyltransferase
MRTTRKLSILILLVIIAACGKPFDSKFELAINQLLSDSGHGSETVYLIMEQSGCTTCLYKADEFYFSNKNEKIEHLKFVFTGYSSLKRLRLKYGISEKDENIIIDSTSVFYKNNVRLEYPSILYFTSSKLKDYEIVGTDNFKAYSFLKDYLNSKSDLN